MKKDGDPNLSGTKLGMESLHKHVLGMDIEGNIPLCLVKYVLICLSCP